MYPSSKIGASAFPVLNVAAQSITMSKPSSGKSAIFVSSSTGIPRSLIVIELSFLSKFTGRQSCDVSNSKKCSYISGLHCAYFKKAVFSVASNNFSNAIFTIQPKPVITYMVAQTAAFLMVKLQKHSF